jgi:3,4-dihydroxy 2-butanone 4-phosphate synthase/GTP cyclohydrolase II
MSQLKVRSTTPVALPWRRRMEAIREAVDAFRRGEFLLVSDDEDRENEGDLVIAAEHATPQAINFMITHGKGLVCLAISPEIAESKGLKPMVARNEDHHGTAFTVSVDGSPEHGVSTGISASDRSKTIELVLSDSVGPEALRAPGHMFPLVARSGGLRVRQGHTEASVELAKLAGCARPAAVIVEVIKEDGEMARRDDLVALSKKFGIRFITIHDLIAYIEWQDALAAPMPAALAG